MDLAGATFQAPQVSDHQIRNLWFLITRVFCGSPVLRAPPYRYLTEHVHLFSTPPAPPHTYMNSLYL